MIVVLAKPQQSGFALLMILVVFIGIAALGLSGLLSSSVEQRHQQLREKNMQVLKQAKQAVLSYAVNYAVSNNLDKMGKLPCPDTAGSTNNEGSQDLNCGGVSKNAIGYFPFKTLGLGKLEDAAGECLWYVVSGDYKNYLDADILNWDSVGYLNLVDENNLLKHGGREDDYPIALIISPGASLGQDRSANVNLPSCKANYTTTNYLEGGPNIDYATDLPDTAREMWSFLTSSEAVHLYDADYNDHIIAIYKHELWNQIEKIDDLSFDNSTGIPANSSIERMTQSLAECLAAFGNNAANVNRQLPYPAPLDLDPTNLDQQEYSDDSNYNDFTIRYGRLPQVLDDSVWNTANFILDEAGLSYCESAAGVTPYDELLWKNWKDHFFYILSEDFDSVSPTTAANKCVAGDCITVNAGADKVAAMIIFAGPALPSAGQDRIWWWDEDNAQVGVDNKSDKDQYLEGGNRIVYAGGTQDYSISNPAAGELDYQFCVEYTWNPAIPDYEFVARKCSDLDGVNDAP